MNVGALLFVLSTTLSIVFAMDAPAQVSSPSDPKIELQTILAIPDDEQTLSSSLGDLQFISGSKHHNFLCSLMTLDRVETFKWVFKRTTFFSDPYWTKGAVCDRLLCDLVVEASKKHKIAICEFLLSQVFDIPLFYAKSIIDIMWAEKPFLWTAQEYTNLLGLPQMKNWVSTFDSIKYVASYEAGRVLFEFLTSSGSVPEHSISSCLHKLAVDSNKYLSDKDMSRICEWAIQQGANVNEKHTDAVFGTSHFDKLLTYKTILAAPSCVVSTLEVPSQGHAALFHNLMSPYFPAIDMYKQGESSELLSKLPNCSIEVLDFALLLCSLNYSKDFFEVATTQAIDVILANGDLVVQHDAAVNGDCRMMASLIESIQKAVYVWKSYNSFLFNKESDPVKVLALENFRTTI